MGYESRVYIVSETYSTFIDGKKPYAEIIAEFDLCKCDYEFVNVFKSEANCYIYINDAPVTKDCYGDAIKSADIIDVYNAIEYGDYWRTTMLKDALHSIIVNRDILSRDFESLKVYHYGY